MNKQINIDYSAIKNLPDLLKILHENEVPSNIIWRCIAAYQEQKAREAGIPLYGQFELTPLCNLDCKMCYVHLDYEQLKGAKLLPAEWWKDIILQAHSMGMMNATLTGGECLTYPGFDDVYLFLRNLGIKASIKTNGILLNQERLSFFVKYPPQRITVSIYGSSNEAYNRVTGHKVFDVVYSNLLQLKNTNIPVNVAITPNKYLFDDVEHLLELVKQLDIPFTVNIMLFPPREETGRILCDVSNEAYAAIFKLLHAGETPQITYQEPIERQDISKKKNPRFGVSCGAGRSFFNIDWKGNITACENLNTLKVNLHESSFFNAWKDIHSDALSYPQPVECEECMYKNTCYNCVAYRGAREKPGHCNPRICDRTKLFAREGITL